MTKVTVRNTSKGNIIIKEGNAGVYRQMEIMEPGKKFVLTLDPNATYREYVLIALPNNVELPAFSSDDLMDCKLIEVKETEGWTESSGKPQFYWEYDPVEPHALTKGGWLQSVFQRVFR